MVNLQKPSATARKIRTRKTRLAIKKKEDTHKAAVRRRDVHCRFPLCGCRKLGLKLEARGEVSHQTHKGAGGNPTGDRSRPELMIYLCKHRHQDGAISIHKGTLRARPLSPDGTKGPVAWEVDASRLWPIAGEKWIEVAREYAVQRLLPLTPRQQVILERLGEMEL